MQVRKSNPAFKNIIGIVGPEKHIYKVSNPLIETLDAQSKPALVDRFPHSDTLFVKWSGAKSTNNPHKLDMHKNVFIDATSSQYVEIHGQKLPYKQINFNALISEAEVHFSIMQAQLKKLSGTLKGLRAKK